MGRRGGGSWGTVKRGSRTYSRFRITIDGRTVERVGLSRASLEKEAKRLQQRARDRLIGDDENATLAAWADRWLEAKRLELGAPGAKTVRNYEVAITRHVVPALGRHKLRDLRAQHRRAFQRALLAKGLKASSVNVVDGILKACLQAAANEDLPVVVSVLTAVRPVRATPEVTPQLTAMNVREILARAEGTFFSALWMVFAFTGARDSEVRALRWEDWDQDAGLLRIRRQLPQQPGDPPAWRSYLKGRKAGRVVPVVAPLAQALREHRARQNEARLACLGWCDYGLVFPDEIGRALGAQRVNRQFSAACTAAGIAVWKGLGVHQLRHAANDILREAGVDTPTRSFVLGHSRAVNEGTYSHENANLSRQAMGQLAKALG